VSSSNPSNERITASVLERVETINSSYRPQATPKRSSAAMASVKNETNGVAQTRPWTRGKAMQMVAQSDTNRSHLGMVLLMTSIILAVTVGFRQVVGLYTAPISRSLSIRHLIASIALSTGRATSRRTRS
jgi:hypothetical protein